MLLLEQSEVYDDRVRGEWIAPWGVAEVRRVGLYDLLMAAGGHHITRHVTYDETLDPAEAEAAALPLGMFRRRRARAALPGPSAALPDPVRRRPGGRRRRRTAACRSRPSRPGDRPGVVVRA